MNTISIIIGLVIGGVLTFVYFSISGKNKLRQIEDENQKKSPPRREGFLKLKPKP